MSKLPFTGQSNPEADAKRLIEDGLALSQQGHGIEAISSFRQGIQQAPGWHLAHFLLGSEHAATGDFAAAEACFAQTVLLAPGFHLARYQLGLLQFSGGRPHVAMVTWSPLQTLGADEPFPPLVAAFNALMSDQVAEAKAYFLAALPVAQNAGLEADIRKLLARLDGQATTEALQSGDATSHVLLSNYSGKTFH